MKWVWLIRLYKLITFSCAPTPLIVVEDIACAFWLYKSRTRFYWSNRVHVLGLLKQWIVIVWEQLHCVFSENFYLPAIFFKSMSLPLKILTIYTISIILFVMQVQHWGHLPWLRSTQDKISSFNVISWWWWI